MKIVILSLAGATYLSYMWAASFFFKIADDSAKRAKKIISFTGFFSIGYCMWSLYKARIGIGLPMLISISCFMLSLLIFWWAIKTLRSQPFNFAFSKEAPTRLVTYGPYQILRHPFYASYSLGWVGALAGSKNILIIPIIIFMGAMYMIAASQEENNFLNSPLKEQYLAYRKKTWKFIPLVY